eukprot:6177412-Pleurochrysis_carterae.AAC.1
MLDICGNSRLHVKQGGCTPFDESSDEEIRGLPHKQQVSSNSRPPIAPRSNLAIRPLSWPAVTGCPRLVRA